MSQSSIPTISTQEFRAELARFLDSSETLAITRHGEVVGYYVPARDPSKLREEYVRFRSSAERLKALLEDTGMSRETLVEKVKTARVSEKIPKVSRAEVQSLLEGVGNDEVISGDELPESWSSTSK